ncbi:MAG: hypothetical protein ACHRXM_04120 [Isosphaerales bacterium]
MKPPSRFGLWPSIGLVIDQEQIALSVMATTLRGRREIACKMQECGGQSPEEVLRRMLEPWIPSPGAKRAKPKPWVQVGVPESQVFQAVVPITHANRNATPQSFFLEAVQATNVRAEDRIIDLLKLELNKQPLACVAASPRGAIASLVDMMNELGTRVGLAEPAPAALYRAGAFYRKAPRGSKLAVRFFLGREQAIGVLAAGAQPLFWHTFDLRPGDETAAILAAYSTLWMLGRHGRITLPIDTLIVHGRPELALTQDPKAFHQRTGARLIRSALPNYDLAAKALGVALANPLANEAGHNLARTLKPAVSIREIFPWGELVLQGALVGAVSLFLIVTAGEANARHQAVGTQLRSFSWLKQQDQAKLDAEKNSLQERLKVMAAFRGSRVGWSVLFRTIAAAAPESTIITGLSGDAEVEATGKSAKPKKQLTVNFATPMSEDGSMPREIDGFLASLRGELMLKQHFPLIEVSGLKANPGKPGEHSFESYSIVCLPLPKVEPIKKATAR